MTWIKKGRIYKKQAQMPVVDVYPKFYRIYHSRRDEFGRSIPYYIDVTKKNFKILKKNYKPILELGKKGYFDHEGVMPTSIISENGIKYLYYVGWTKREDVPYHNSLGLAISGDNGKTWKKYSEGPILATNRLEPGFIGTAEVFRQGDYGYVMLYSSCKWENGLSIYDIKIATSDDLVNWKIIPNNTVIPLEGKEGGISAVRKIDNTLYYSIRNKRDFRTNPEHSYKIKSTRINVEEKILELDVTPRYKGWDSEMVAYPYIIKENNKLIMFYNGNGFGKTGLGYAIKELE